MKSTGTMIGGRSCRQWYSPTRATFVRFIRAYEAEGIPIHAVTCRTRPASTAPRSAIPGGITRRAGGR